MVGRVDINIPHHHMHTSLCNITADGTPLLEILTACVQSTSVSRIRHDIGALKLLPGIVVPTQQRQRKRRTIFWVSCRQFFGLVHHHGGHGRLSSRTRHGTALSSRSALHCSRLQPVRTNCTTGGGGVVVSFTEPLSSRVGLWPVWACRCLVVTAAASQPLRVSLVSLPISFRPSLPLFPSLQAAMDASPEAILQRLRERDAQMCVLLQRTELLNRVHRGAISELPPSPEGMGSRDSLKARLAVIYGCQDQVSKASCICMHRRLLFIRGCLT